MTEKEYASFMRQFELARQEIAELTRIFGPDAMRWAALTFPRLHTPEHPRAEQPHPGSEQDHTES